MKSRFNHAANLTPERLEKRLLLSAFSLERASFNHTLGIEANGDSYEPCLSGDGRYAAFESRANNLIIGDFNGMSDIFLFDRLARTTIRVSVTATGAEANKDCFSASISADGRFVAFVSAATNLVPDDNNDAPDVFVKDTLTGALARVSLSDSGTEGDGPSFNPELSGDGRFIVFESLASNLVEGDTNGCSDIFLYELATGSCRIVSADGGTPGDGDSYAPVISADSAYVAFTSEAANLADGDLNEVSDIFLYDTAGGALTRITDGNGPSLNPHLSADGRIIVFESAGTNIVDGDINGLPDVFLRDLTTGTSEIISRSKSATGPNAASFNPCINADGSVVAFISLATNLVDVDINGVADLFAFDRSSGETRIVNLSPTGQQTAKEVAFVAMSPGINLLAFDSFANNLVPGDSAARQDCFIASALPNSAPTGLDMELRAAKNVSLRFTLDAADEDADPLSIFILKDPAHGTLTGDGLEKTYAPDPGYLGTDSFTYLVSDGLFYTVPATVMISVEEILEPDIMVVENSGAPNDDLIEFGNVELGGAFFRTMTIRNSGTEPLQLTGWNLSGSDAYTLQPATPPAAPLNPGAQTTLTVRCQPFSVGDHATRLYISSNDPDEAQYFVDVQGTAISTSGSLGSVVVNGVTVHIFDMDGLGVGKNIDGDFGPGYNPYSLRNDVQVLSAGPGKGVVIILKNDFTGLGLAAEGPIATIADTRRIGAGDVAFVASTGDIGTVIVNSYMSGADINGLEVSPAWTLPADVDGDGSTGDFTAIYCGGNLGVVLVNGIGPGNAGLAGDVVSEGGLNVFVCSGDMAGDINAATQIKTVYVGYKATRPANLIGDVITNGAAQTIIATGDGSGGVNAGSIGMYYVMGSAARSGGDIRAISSITNIYAGKGIDKDVAVTSGPVQNIVALNGHVRGSFEAWWFGYVASVAGDVRANIEATAPTGQSGVISAKGRFAGTFLSEGSLNTLMAASIGEDGGNRTVVRTHGSLNVLYSLGDMVRTDIGVGADELAAGAKVSLGTVYVKGAFRSSNIVAGCWGAEDRPFPAGVDAPAPHIPLGIESRVGINLVYIGGAVGNAGASDDFWVIAASGPIRTYYAVDKDPNDVLIVGNVT
ncbi:MAG TPA: choice-of-anchor D domain-containing protein [Candidatus Brocadiia bacterium]|nr:choice-of-anchor D domain-containing protein [Candidatus Brocadiia bacterium]